MSGRFSIFFYLSLGFLCFALYRANYLQIPSIGSMSDLMLSFLFLFLGFLSNALSWQKILKSSDVGVGYRTALASVGLSIFGKYIPGKLWLVVGRATYISDRCSSSLGTISAISLRGQFLVLWAGLIAGAIGLFAIGGWQLWGTLTLCSWLALSVIIFSRKLNSISESLLSRILGKKISLPFLAAKDSIEITPWYFLNWLLWSCSFYFLVTSLLSLEVATAIGLGFPLAASLGIMALFAPGGLGIREGLLVGYLSFAGIGVPEATTVAFASRLWFLIGEIFVFIVAVAVGRKDTVLNIDSRKAAMQKNNVVSADASSSNS